MKEWQEAGYHPPTMGVEKPTPSTISEEIIAHLFHLNKLILKLNRNNISY